MTHYPPPGAEIDLYLVYSRCAKGTFIDGAFTNKTQAESAMRIFKDWDRNNSEFWIRELRTQPHER